MYVCMYWICLGICTAVLSLWAHFCPPSSLSMNYSMKNSISTGRFGKTPGSKNTLRSPSYPPEISSVYNSPQITLHSLTAAGSRKRMWIWVEEESGRGELCKGGVRLDIKYEQDYLTFRWQIQKQHTVKLEAYKHGGASLLYYFKWYGTCTI